MNYLIKFCLCCHDYYISLLFPGYFSYGLKEVEGVRSITGEGLKKPEGAGVISGGGKWPGR